MHSVCFRILAGSALTLILAASASAAPEAPDTSADHSPAMPAPVERDYNVPGSMPKPSALMPAGDGLRFRGTLPASNGIGQRLERLAPAAPTANAPEPPAPALRAPAAQARNPVPIPPPAPQSAPRPTAAQAPAAVPGPAASSGVARTAVPAADPAIGDRIRELLASKRFEQLVALKTDRDAISAFYQKARDFQPLWVAPGGPSERARDVIDTLQTVDAEGLEPKDYALPNLAVSGAQAPAEAELKFTAIVLTYARHAMNGRVHFSRVSPNIEYKLSYDAGEALKSIAASRDLRQTLASFNPPHQAYQALKAKLAELRQAAPESAPPRFENGPVLRYYRDRRGRESIMSDPRVPRLRARLGLAAEPNANYDRSLAAAVGKFQKAHGIKPTGQLNGPTLEALNGPSRARQIDAVLATMERWRWMPRDLGRTHVMLNIPDYHLRIYHDGEKVWQTRVVVGKPTQQTPLLTETMKFITVNPTWNVPQSIIYNELLPIYETSDPQIFARMGLKVERDRDGSVRVFQPPGERNALGQIRFNFPNKFLVYQHDTPERYYFSHEQRAYSHGCMRVQDPLKYAEVLLSYASPRLGVSQARIRQMFGGPEQQIDFHTQIPVHITYQTAFVDEDGKLQLRDDVYGLDAKVLELRRGSERAVADAAIERPADPNFKPTPEAAQRLHSVARGISNPFALFEQLFR
jgi:murein L,D-transpeptidase YcbB/YkuD